MLQEMGSCRQWCAFYYCDRYVVNLTVTTREVVQRFESCVFQVDVFAYESENGRPPILSPAAQAFTAKRVK